MAVRESAITLRQAKNALIAFLLVLAGGTACFYFISGEGLFEAFYRTIITISTAGLVGAPQGTDERILTVVLIIWGVAIFLYVFGLVIELAVRGTISGALQERKDYRRVDRLKGHYIVCGYGRMGRSVAEQFRRAGVGYVVLDSDAETTTEAREDEHLALVGNASEDEALERAGIERAGGLVAAVGSDAENVYIVLTARQLRPELPIVARASDDDAAKKVLRAGADRVVSPYSTAGRAMATMVLHPHVASFLDVFASADAPSFQLEEIEVTLVCGQAGKSIRELNVRETTGAMIIAHKQRGGEFDTRPNPNTPLEAGDVLIGVGTPEEIRALEDLFGPREALAR